MSLFCNLFSDSIKTDSIKTDSRPVFETKSYGIKKTSLALENWKSFIKIDRKCYN